MIHKAASFQTRQSLQDGKQIALTADIGRYTLHGRCDSNYTAIATFSEDISQKQVVDRAREEDLHLDLIRRRAYQRLLPP